MCHFISVERQLPAGSIQGSCISLKELSTKKHVILLERSNVTNVLKSFHWDSSQGVVVTSVISLILSFLPRIKNFTLLCIFLYRFGNRKACEGCSAVDYLLFLPCCNQKYHVLLVILQAASMKLLTRCDSQFDGS